MRKTILLAVVCAMTAAMAGESSLFNGKDLSGWLAVADYDYTGGYTAAEPTWAVVDGCIRTTGTPFGYLRTKRSDFGDCTIRLEYRWWRKTDKPNSGVFVRISAERGSFLPTCIENQLCPGKACDALGLGGATFDGLVASAPADPAKPLQGIVVGPRKAPSAEKPFGEWNVLEIELKGGTMKNRLKGIEQNTISGIVAAKGAIALQAEGGAVEFRNVTVVE